MVFWGVTVVVAGAAVAAIDRLYRRRHRGGGAGDDESQGRARYEHGVTTTQGDDLRHGGQGGSVGG